MFILLPLYLLVFLFTQDLQAMPARVMLIRSAEIPEHGNGLSLRGQERALAYVPFFQATDYLQDFGWPVAIYAHRQTSAEPTVRTLLTVGPLAQALNLPIFDKYGHNDIANLVAEIKNTPAYEGKAVLICWGNERMWQIAEQFGVKPPPKPWPNEAHDRVWVIDIKYKEPVAFKNYPQRLLYGDSYN